MACCTSSIAGGCIGGLNLPALARYRTAPDNPDAMPRPPGAYCRVLGPVQVTLAGADAPPELLWRKHVALLVYLARSPRRRRTREHLVGLLWSERDEKPARHSLSEALRVFRRVLGDDQVQADVDQIGLGADGVTLDCDRFAELYAHGDWPGAAALVEGDFLEGLSIPDASQFEDWLGGERVRWRAQSVDALVRHADGLLAQGDAAAAATAALRARGVDRASEPAARAAMRALALAGDRAAALRVADDVAGVLADQVGTAPGPETVRLIDRIREARVGRRVLAAPPAARPRPVLCGRGSELAALAAAWERAKSGRGQVIIVEGEPGEGKSRLIEELVARARLDDAAVAAARAVAVDQRKDWSAVAGLLAAGLADAPGIAGAPPDALAALVGLAPDLAVRFRHTDAALPVGEGVRDAVLAAAQERPVLLALDDAHWIDAATLESLPGLARDAARRPVLLLFGLARGAPESGRLGAVRARVGRELEGEVIRLGRLDPAALHALVAWALPAYAAPDAQRLARRVEQDTAGIPLLAIALLEAVADGLKLAPDAPAWPAPKRTLVDSLPNDLPPAVVGMVCLRFRRLPAAAQQLLGAAAALGERVDVGQLATATRLERTAVEPALDLLEWERWLAADARGYVFTAPIVRSILLQEMVTPGQAKRYRENRST